ncbi:cupin domain-containing protein [Nisaea sp.]|uniref:cupin domain-containing protein n=1 Tax=Nisaea sp. TaxID=2024842 RepID=UPI003B529B97
MKRDDQGRQAKILPNGLMATSTNVLRLVKDVFSPHAVSKNLPDAFRILYCNGGDLAFEGGSVLQPDEARYMRTGYALRAGTEGGELWRWEVGDAKVNPELDLGEGIRSELVVSNDVPSVEKLEDWLIRCDSVLFPTGGTAVPHTHIGPGIRCMRNGKLTLSTDTKSQDYHPGDAWFEPGGEAVWASACTDECTRFIRVLLLPKELKGKSSIRYLNEADRRKPKSQRYKSYVDELLSLK